MKNKKIFRKASTPLILLTLMINWAWVGHANAQVTEISPHFDLDLIIGKWQCQYDDSSRDLKMSTVDEYWKNGRNISTASVELIVGQEKIHYKTRTQQKWWVIGNDTFEWADTALLSFQHDNAELEEMIQYKKTLTNNEVSQAKILELNETTFSVQYLDDEQNIYGKCTRLAK